MIIHLSITQSLSVTLAYYTSDAVTDFILYRLFCFQTTVSNVTVELIFLLHILELLGLQLCPDTDCPKRFLLIILRRSMQMLE
jgi:hypothetical protein